MIVDDGPIDTFIRTLSSLPAEEWQRRIGALQKLISSTPDYSTTYNPNNDNGDGDGDGDGGTQQHDINAAVAAMTPSSRPHKFNISSNSNNNNNGSSNTVIPWYHSSKSVRRLGPPLKTLLLDARSAVVKEATELIAILLCVKLQSHPKFTTLLDIDDDDNENDNEEGESAVVNNDNNDELHEIFSNHATISTATVTPTKQRNNKHPHPPPFVGRLLFKDLLQPLLQLSSQTVKVIRTYGNSLTLQVLPVCRVKSSIVILVERMKSDKNRNVREDCGRYLRCVLETWPGWVDDDEENGESGGGKSTNNNNINTRKDEQLSYECTQQIGLGIGRALTDPAQNVRNEAKRGFQIIFHKYRNVWNEVMNSGVIRDTRLRKNLLEAASRECGELFDDMASLGDMSLNSGMSFTSMRSNMSYRSYASRGIGAAAGGAGERGGRAIPSVIGTPKVRKTSRYSPSTSTSSPSYMRSTAASSSSSSPTSKIRNKESSSTYSSSNYVLSSGHVVSSSTPQRTSRLPPPSPRNRPASPSLSSPTKDRTSMTPPPKQPFASLMQTPQPNKNQTATTPTQQLRQYGNSNNIVNADSHHHNSPKSAKMLRKRLSRRISGIGGLETTSLTTSAGGSGVGANASANTVEAYKRQLSSIAEKSDGSVTTTVATSSNGGSSSLSSSSSPASTANNHHVNSSSSNSDEITFVALEVIAAHLAHLDKIETQISHEKDLLLDLNKQLGISISNATNSDELARCLGKLTEEQVCDYFESVHICVDLQRNASESLLREMERISQGGGGGGADVSMSSDTMGVSNGGTMHQSPDGLDRLQRDLGSQF